MSAQSIKLAKGDLITIKGQALKIAIATKVKAIKVQDSTGTESVGSHQSDLDPQRFKRIVCQIIEDKIKALKREEDNALCSINQDDVLFLFEGAEEAPKTSFSEQVERTSSIVDLKQILKQIKAL